MFDTFEQRTLSIDGTTISFVTAGSARPCCCCTDFRRPRRCGPKSRRCLPNTHTVVAADLRGYGDSAKPACLPDHSNYPSGPWRKISSPSCGRSGTSASTSSATTAVDESAIAWRSTIRIGVLSLAVLDIVPTYAMFMDTNRHVAATYWHWYFLAQPAPFPERLIGYDPDFFFETCLVGWGKTALENFDSEMIAEYRRCWRDPAAIHGMTADYRAAATIDLAHDTADIDKKVACPALAMWGTLGAMHRLFDMGAEWRKRCADLETATLPGGHFFVDQYPEETARLLQRFLASNNRAH